MKLISLFVPTDEGVIDVDDEIRNNTRRPFSVLDLENSVLVYVNGENESTVFPGD